MKSKFKKTAAIIAAAVMAFSMYSCGQDSSDKNSSSDEAAGTNAVITETSEDVTDTDSDNASETQTSDSTVPVESEPTTDIDVDSLKFEFDGLKSENYIKMLTGGHYKMIGSQNSQKQKAYVDMANKRLMLETEYMGLKFSMLISDGVEYTVLGDMYVKNESAGGSIDSFVPYKSCGFVESGEQEINGTTYDYDQFYDTESKVLTKLLMDKEGKIYGIEENGNSMVLEELSSEFDDSIFNILEGCKEVSEEEFMNLLMGSGGEETPAE